MKNVIALGFFDLIHNGHIAIFKKTIEIADELSATPSVFTFSNDIYKVLGKRNIPVNSFEERAELIKSFGIKRIISQEGTKEFLSLSGKEFLDFLVKHYSAVALICGEDFRCGKNAEYGVKEIENYCKENGLLFCVESLLYYNGNKIGSRLIKNLLLEGKVDEIAAYLGRNFQVKGKVVDGRKEGRLYGFPTANIFAEHCILMKGVYQTEISFDNMSFKAVTNVGDHPTIGDNVNNIESFLIDFKGDLYQKVITVKFIRLLRDIYKFSSKEELFLQISNDVDAVRSGKETKIIGERK